MQEYCSEANLDKIDQEGPKYLIGTQKDWKQRQALAEVLGGLTPDHISERERMERKLKTKRGRALYKKRGQIY